MRFLHRFQSKLAITLIGTCSDNAEILQCANVSVAYFFFHLRFCRSCLIKAWELMYLFSSAMPPSKDIAAYLSEYIHNVVHGANTDPDVQILALNTLNSLKRSVKSGPRLKIPLREEIEALLIGKKLTTIVFFLDETFEEIAYDMTTTVGDAVQVFICYIFLCFLLAMPFLNNYLTWLAYRSDPVVIVGACTTLDLFWKEWNWPSPPFLDE